MEKIGERAVVVGASMAGLLAARVLADAGRAGVRSSIVTSCPEQDVARRAVPQGRHVHALLPAGPDVPGGTAAGPGGRHARRRRAELPPRWRTCAS